MKKTVNSRVILFWSLFGLITVAFAIVLAFRLVDSVKYDDYDDINKHSLNINVASIFSPEAKGEYYVFVYKAYDSYVNITSDTKSDELKPLILSYYNFVKQNKRKNVVPIYSLNIDSVQNQNSLTTTENTSTSCNDATKFRVNERDLPLVIKCENGAIESSNGVLKSFESIQKSFQEIWEYYLGKTNISYIIPRIKEEYVY